MRGLVSRPGLVTLVGPAGIGKTRLALEIARESASASPVRVTIVELGALSDASLVAQSAASALGLHEQGDSAWRDRLVAALSAQQYLLIVDNCEHLALACAQLAEDLLQHCPRLRILATSREPLRIDGERTFPLTPLPLAATAVQPSEAARLFIERARAALPQLDLDAPALATIEMVCQQLDGIPLALELAAARVRHLGIEGVASRLPDRFNLLQHGRRTAPARHQTMRAALDWSYDLLSEPERMLFQRASVFSGGWTLDAAETVCSENGIAKSDVLDLLSRLVDRSLVEVEVAQHANTPVRYHMLESVRQYAAQRLEVAHGTDVLRERHARFFTNWTVARIHAPILDNDPRFSDVEADHHNLRSALRWLIDHREVGDAERLATALGPFWFFYGYFGEGKAWLAEILSLPIGESGQRGRAPILFRAGQLAWCLGDFPVAQTRLEQSAAIFEELRDELQLGQAIVSLAHLARSRGDYPRSRALYEEGLRLSEKVGYKRMKANVLLGLCQSAYEQQEYAEARRWGEQALDFTLRRATPGRQMTSIAIGVLQFLGAADEREGQIAAAHERVSESVRLARDLGPHGRWWVVMGLPALARIVAAQGDCQTAKDLAREALTLARDVGDRQALARSLEASAFVAAKDGQHKRAMRLAAAADGLREVTGAPLGPADRSIAEGWLRQSRLVLGAATASAAWQVGRGLDLEAALAEAEALIQNVEHVPDGLTPREREVVTLLAGGLTNRQIGERLVITEATVIRHVSNVLAKLNMASRAQIAVWAAERGLVLRN